MASALTAGSDSLLSSMWWTVHRIRGSRVISKLSTQLHCRPDMHLLHHCLWRVWWVNKAFWSSMCFLFFVVFFWLHFTMAWLGIITRINTVHFPSCSETKVFVYRNNHLGCSDLKLESWYWYILHILTTHFNRNICSPVHTCSKLINQSCGTQWHEHKQLLLFT